MCKSFLCFGIAQEWVWEGDPDFCYFSWSKIIVQLIYLCTQECSIINGLVKSCFGTAPDSVSFQVYAKKVPFRVSLCQCYCIISLSAGEFKREGIVIFKEGRPLSRHIFRVY